MEKAKKGSRMLLFTVVLVFGIFFGFRLSRWTGFGPASRVMNTPVLLKEVQTLSELVTVKYVMQKAEVWNDPPKPILALFGVGDNHILLMAQGVVKAGVDLAELQTNDLHVVEKTIIVTLPPAKVTDAYLDDKETKVVERTTGFLRSFDKDLEQHIRATTVEDLKLAALRGGIRKDADDRARAQLKALFLRLGFEKVEFRERPS